jgi:hypothetical protein
VTFFFRTGFGFGMRSTSRQSSRTPNDGLPDVPPINLAGILQRAPQSAQPSLIALYDRNLVATKARLRLMAPL